ncbi:MAG TPA: hydroxymethylbilane synthase [Cytophagales bacterium]|nr:hydroxymethylbilane synthase [Cytophagales bacterium]
MKQKETIRIGSRGSRLALWQAEYISQCLATVGLSSEIIVINTKGDKILDRSLSKIGSKGLFTAELEEALIDGHIHIAVHSAKDMSTSLPDELEVISYTERELVNDALVSHKDLTLDTPGIVIGTSSTRRVALLRHYYPHVRIVDMRGNLQTRVKKMEEGACDALLLAYAGAHRMDFGPLIKQKISTEQFIPAVGQGTLAIEASKQLDPVLRSKIVEATSNKEAELQTQAETTYLRLINGGCSIPVFALAEIYDEKLKISGGIVSLDGKTIIKDSIIGPKQDAREIGRQLFDSIKGKGGLEILTNIKRDQNEKNN